MATKKEECCTSQCLEIASISISVRSRSESTDLDDTNCPTKEPKSPNECNKMVDETKDEEKHNSDDELDHKGLLGSIHEAVAEVEDLLSSIKVKDEMQGDDGSSQTGDDDDSYYYYGSDSDMSLHEELENLDDLEKDLAIKLRRAEAFAIQRAQKQHGPQVVRPPGEGKGRRARARNARERREREARETSNKEDDEQQSEGTAKANGQQQPVEGSSQQGTNVIAKPFIPLSERSRASYDDYDTMSQASCTTSGSQHPTRPPFEGKGRRARARRARERREVQDYELAAGEEATEVVGGAEVAGGVAGEVQAPTVSSPEPKTLNPAASVVSPPFEGKGRRARARRARERWENSQCDSQGYAYHSAVPVNAVPVNGEIHYYQH